MHLESHRQGGPAVGLGTHVRDWLVRSAVLLLALGAAGWVVGVRSATPAHALANNLEAIALRARPEVHRHGVTPVVSSVIARANLDRQHERSVPYCSLLPRS